MIVALKRLLPLLLIDGTRGDYLSIGIVGIVRHGISTNDFDVNHVADVHTLEQGHDILMGPA